MSGYGLRRHCILLITCCQSSPPGLHLAGHGGAIFSAVNDLMTDSRVVVFIDYQNVYHRARDAFFPSGEVSSILGSVHPFRLGELLCDLGRNKEYQRALIGVRVYRGKPDSRSGLNLSRAFDRQVASWRQTPRVTVRTRPFAIPQSLEVKR